ncbi:hypothetical protein MKX01_042439 [Papaver californicum]|nr:hypothetical protein MKX01_042439 [Papaver californicum]
MSRLTTSICFSPLFIGLIFILSGLMNSEGVDGVKCTVVPFTDATCDFICRDRFGENVPIVCEENLGYDFPTSSANYVSQALNPIESNTCQCCTKVG